MYTQGQVYLATGQGREAVGEFRKIIDHPGMVTNCATGALARLGLGRAYALEADNGAKPRNNACEPTIPQPDALPKARAAYKDFFKLWKDADPDIPILKRAKSEYAKLQ